MNVKQESTVETEQAFDEIGEILNLLEGSDAINILATFLKAGIDGVHPVEMRVAVLEDIISFLRDQDHATQ